MSTIDKTFKSSQFTPPKRSDIVSSRPAWTKSVQHKTRGLLFFGLTLVLCCVVCALCVKYFAQESNTQNAKLITPTEWAKPVSAPVVDPQARWQHIWHNAVTPLPITLTKGGSVTQNLRRSKWAQLGYTDLSRGLVLNAGPHTDIHSVLSHIREAGCSWPIEVWHLDQVSLSDLKPYRASACPAEKLINLRNWVEVTREQNPVHSLTSAKLQALSIFMSSFEQVLFVDADHWNPDVLRWPNSAHDLKSTILEETGVNMWVNRQQCAKELWCVFRILQSISNPDILTNKHLYQLTWTARHEPFAWAKDLALDSEAAIQMIQSGGEF